MLEQFKSQSVVIVGGGIIGSSIAWFLREEGFGGEITVVERDPTYQFSSTSLSAASIRTQFTSPVNVLLSQFGARFLKNLSRHLGEEVEISFVEQGYLILQGEAVAASQIDAVLKMQRDLGCKVDQLGVDALASRFPWLSVDGLAGGTYGVEDEGWFDAWALLSAMRSAAIARGVRYVKDEMTGARMSGDRIAAVQLASGTELSADVYVNAAGALSGRVGAMVGVDLPIAPKKRCVFHFKSPLEAPDMPMLFDMSGVWVRPEGNGYIGGLAPEPDQDPDAYGDFDCDYALFEEKAWLLLANRVPAFEELRILNAWAGHYDMNVFDHNAILGSHPDVANLVLACGFSGHGVMHAPGAARAIAEHIVHGEYKTIDVSPLGFERVVANRPYTELVVY